MKKLVIGSLVGGILMFIWQFLSWTVLNLHYPAYQYTPKQDAILNVLNTEIDAEGGYMIPSHPQNASMEEQQAAMEAAQGKPMAVISYHRSMTYNMTSNIIRALVVDILVVAFFCAIIGRMAALNFTAILISSIFVGMIVFFNIPYTNHIWFKSFDLLAYLIDSVVSWTLVGIWLGWLYGRKRA